jgi:NAD+ synthase (glutamine-hydrolysing)
MKFMLVQINPTVGALEENAAHILRDAQMAAAVGADVVVFPELALSGYPPDDLVLRPRFMDAVERSVDALMAQLPPDVLVAFGAPMREADVLWNTALLFHGGRRVGVAKKILLPNDGVFDERRLFTPGTEPLVYSFKGVRLAVHICEDSWWPGSQSFEGLRARCDVLLNLSASPFSQARETDREVMARAAARSVDAPVLYTNLVGGQDELVFDGGALAVSAAGDVAARSRRFREGALEVEVVPGDGRWHIQDGGKAPVLGALPEVYEALKLGVKDYTKKNGFPGVLIALSGGIDSALVATVAVDALGKERVMGVTMPSVVTSNETFSDALELARRLGIACLQIPIASAVETLEGLVRQASGGVDWVEPLPGTLMEENLQARTRGVLVMALSNRFGHLVLTTGNKSEMATGYATLYGDMCGGFAPIKDVPKMMVFALARWRNKQGEIIPASTIERPPSAELKPGQQDSDSLPPYDVLDAILERYVEQQIGVKDIVADGFDEETVRRVVRLVDRSEYKRRQGAPGIKITPKAFGRDRRMPITNGFCE